MPLVGSIAAGNVLIQGCPRRSNWRRNNNNIKNSVILVANDGRLRRLERERFRLRAVSGKDKDKNGGDEQDGADERAQATIEKSKKVLEVQNDLLEQIAKGRNFVTVISTETSSEKQKLSDSDPEIDEPSSIDSSLEASSQHIPQKTTSISENPTPITKSKPLEENKPEVAISEKIQEPKLDSSVLSPSTILPPPVEISENKTEETEPVFVSSHNNNTSFEEEKKEAGPLAGTNVMNVILVAAECAPWSKTGGLGDVVGALPKALAKRGHRVMVVVPKYGNYAEAQEIGVRRYYKVEGQDMEVNYYHAYIDGVDFVFLDCPFFRHRENDIYGGQRMDILKRMVLLCKAAVEVPWYVPCGGVCYGDGNLAFIANDWHTALLPVYLKAYYRDNGLMQYARSILVIHNIAHQGRGPMEDLRYTDLPGHYSDLFKLYDPMGGDHFNVFAAGLKAADRVVTVSHGYTWEIKTVEGGWGLHEIINHNHWKVTGIVNGIDDVDWNPKFDVHLKSDGYVNYEVESLDEGKRRCKEALQRELGLEVRAGVPVIAFIGRLDYQKGIDLIAEAIPWLVSQDVQLVMLGTGRQDLENLLRKFEGEHRDKVRAWVGFSVPMAHRITAGADVIMMPSRFEPCGLNQLYAMMYGTIPVVHAVGGLRDTVVPFDPFGNSGFGWTFDRAEVGKLIDALGNCLNTYWNYKESWKGLQVRGMMQDLSWDVAAQKYEEVLVAAKYQW